MAALDTTRIATTGSFGLVGRIGAFFASVVNVAVAEWNDARVTRNALSGLTDRELDDIGLWWRHRRHRRWSWVSNRLPLTHAPSSSLWGKKEHRVTVWYAVFFCELRQ